MTSLGSIALAAVFALAGAALAAADLALLRVNVRLYLAGGGVAAPIAVHALRALGLLAALVGLTLLCARALLLAVAGFTALRLAVLFRLRGGGGAMRPRGSP